MEVITKKNDIEGNQKKDDMKQITKEDVWRELQKIYEGNYKKR